MSSSRDGSVQPAEIQEFKLDPDSELRFEVEGKSCKVVLELKSGLAEVFGTEIVKGKNYTFYSGAKMAVFTWQGCILELKGKPEVAYVAKVTPMVMYLNVHVALEQLRNKAEEENKRGPILMITGPTDVGKSSLARILLNYAVRLGRKPLFVDLDVGQGQISIPGTIGAVLVERPATVEEGFSLQAPLVQHYGHASAGGNLPHFKMLISRLADVCRDRLEESHKVNVSGMVINTCGWVKGDGYRQLVHSATAFEVDIIIVLDHERLYNELVRDMPAFVKVVLLPKTGGVVERSKSARADARDSCVRAYFYGGKSRLYPHSFEVRFNEVRIYKIGAPALPDSCMPLGMSSEDNMTKLVAVQPGLGLLHHLLAVSFSSTVDDDVIQNNIAGYICVTNVDMERQMLTVLAPLNRPLPNTILLWSDVQFMDTH